MRKLVKVALVVGAAFAMFASSGTAAVAAPGGGTVSGTVSTSPGINTTPRAQTISFSGIVISGLFNSNDLSQHFVGTVNTVGNVSATGVNEWLPMGQGSVSSFGITGSGTTTLTGTCAGSYQRVGSIVVVPLNCGGSVGGRAFNGSVNVVAQFSPTAGDGVVNPITQANFTGAYGLV